MSLISERLNAPVSLAELERRWRLVRAAMRSAGIDALLIQNNNDHMGGYVKYFTDVPAVNGYPVEVVFPVDDEMTVVRMGPFDGEISPSAETSAYRGVRRIYTTPSFVTAGYTKTYSAKLVEKALRPYAKGTIGLICPMQIGSALIDCLRNDLLPDTKFVDATDIVDNIKCIKSPEEIELIRATAHLQDAAIATAFKQIQPGMRDREVAAIAKYYSERHGSEQGIYLCASAPAGTPFAFGPSYFQNRVLQEGDQYILLVENNGPGGQYTEIGRTCVLGPVPVRLKEEHKFTLEARRFTLDLLKPGTPCATIWKEYNTFMKRNLRPEEKRLHCHGQGCDMVERPLIRADETMSIQENMNIAVHPMYIKDGVMSWICDNYIIGPDGPEPRLHQFPEEIVEI